MITATEAGQISAMNYKTELDRLRENFTLVVKTAAEFGYNKAYFSSTDKYAVKLQLLDEIRAAGYETVGWLVGAGVNFHDITVYWGE
jgi:hypothetical protein